MTAYSITLYIHLLALVLAMATASLVTFAMLQIRSAETIPEIARWGGLIKKIVPAFPVAAIGLFGTGAYMTQHVWSWSTPWIDAAIAGLVLLMVAGDGVSGRRGRALEQELKANGLTDRARRLQCDPAGWSAHMTTLTVTGAIMFVMTTKPDTAGSTAAIVVGVLAGVAGAVPIWRSAQQAEGPAVTEPAA
jgi:hypothetical protein